MSVTSEKKTRFFHIDPTEKGAVAVARADIKITYRFNIGISCKDYLNRLAVIRTRELELYLAHRYGHVLPEGDDAALEDLVILLNHIAQNRVAAYCKMQMIASLWAPWMPSEAKIALLSRILKRPRRYSAKRLGELTALTEEEHTLLGITSWWPHTWNEVEVRAGQKQKRQDSDRKAKTAKRRADGVVSRDEYLAQSKTRTEPWKAAGFKCRRTWERHLKRAAAEAETPKCRKSVVPIRKDSYRDDTPATRLGGINLRLFGITGVTIQSGGNVISEWRQAA